MVTSLETKGSAVRARGGNAEILTLVGRLYFDLFEHDGFGELSIEVRLLKRGQKEVIVRCGKQYRFVVDYDPSALRDGPGSETGAGASPSGR